MRVVLQYRTLYRAGYRDALSRGVPPRQSWLVDEHDANGWPREDRRARRRAYRLGWSDAAAGWPPDSRKVDGLVAEAAG